MLPISGDDGTQWAQKQVAKNWVDLQQHIMRQPDCPAEV
jgi:hypothetical protein